MTRLAFPTDEHRPFHDGRAVELAMQIVRDFDPDVLITGSDALDFYAISTFDKNPFRLKAGGLQQEIDDWLAAQRAWRDAAPRARKRFIPGNHEDRLRRYLWTHPEIADLEALQLPELLQFDTLGIEWDDQESSEVVIDEQLVIKHGRFARKFSAASASGELENERHAISGLSGHTHRGGTYLAQTRRGLVQWVEAFCLCRLDPEYIDRPDWQQGIVLATVHGGLVSIEAVPFHDFRCRKVAVWRGREYLA